MGIYNSNYDFNKYKTFYAVAEAKSFSKASETLHISQPAISYAIKELESTLNTKLFYREKNGVILTDDGEKLMFYLQKAFSNIIKAEKIITEREEEATGLVRIGIYSHISTFMLPKLIKEFQHLHPQAKFSIFQSTNKDLLEVLRRRDVDFIILQYPIFLEKNNFEEEILCTLETCFYGNKEMYDKYSNPDIEHKYPLVLPFSGYADIDSLEEKLKRHNINFYVGIRCYDSITTTKLVKEGLGIGWGLKRFIKYELDNQKLYEIPLKFENPPTIYSVAYDKKFLNKTAEEFLKYLKENLDDVIN